MHNQPHNDPYSTVQHTLTQEAVVATLAGDSETVNPVGPAGGEEET
jgi:hypothetical protein